jgi:hypothetical protein
MGENKYGKRQAKLNKSSQLLLFIFSKTDHPRGYHVEETLLPQQVGSAELKKERKDTPGGTWVERFAEI